MYQNFFCWTASLANILIPRNLHIVFCQPYKHMLQTDFLLQDSVSIANINLNRSCLDLRLDYEWFLTDPDRMWPFIVQVQFQESLQLNEKSGQQCVYELNAIVIHTGMLLDNGHYFAVTKNYNHWHLKNDETVMRVRVPNSFLIWLYKIVSMFCLDPLQSELLVTQMLAKLAAGE